uniref:Uncharacterized protein n=1 Tax=Vitis vinifera TaxID=29760 RepID=A5BEG0_VITVI|nr:hypothetical protein VITISV_002082 [Vitis vinifera]
MTARVITTGIVVLAAVVVMMIIGFTVFEVKDPVIAIGSILPKDPIIAVGLVAEKSMGYFPMNGVFSVNKIGVSHPGRTPEAITENEWRFMLENTTTHRHAFAIGKEEKS